uniref:Uncharacterized protein n=1 Tax=Anguilla anguilla TaxID=7936 RepID=A0A0E9Q3D1_ANGAN
MPLVEALQWDVTFEADSMCPM